jgi:hypothetical protein
MVSGNGSLHERWELALGAAIRASEGCLADLVNRSWAEEHEDLIISYLQREVTRIAESTGAGPRQVPKVSSIDLSEYRRSQVERTGVFVPSDFGRAPNYPYTIVSAMDAFLEEEERQWQESETSLAAFLASEASTQDGKLSSWMKSFGRGKR